MPTESELLALVERLDALAEPTRETDGEIAKLILGWTYEKKERCRQPYWFKPGAEWYSREEKGPPRYTSSIDAAMTLVPDGFKWKVGYTMHVSHVAELRDYRDQPILGTFIGECDSNRAIALCIAAMKARLSLLKGGE